MKKKNNGQKKYRLIVLSILLIVIIFCMIFVVYKIFINFKDKKNIEIIDLEIQKQVKIETLDSSIAENVNPPHDKNDLYWEFINYDLLNVNIEDLKKINNDTTGWIKVNNSNVNYPIVQTSDNDYYLTHQFDKKWNSAGWIYMDYRNNKDFVSNKNSIIYGHGLINDSMFGSLSEALKSSWYTNKDNLVIQTACEKYSFLWQIFSIYTIPTTNDYIQTDFNDNEEYIIFLNTITSRSVNNFNVSLNEDDKILTLSTCYTGSKKLVIHAKLIKISDR